MNPLKSLKVVVIVVSMVVLFPIGQAKTSTELDYVPGEAVVGFTQEGWKIRHDLVRKYGGMIKEEEPMLRAVIVKVPEGKEVPFIKAIRKEKEVRYAESNYLFEFARIPNDPLLYEPCPPPFNYIQPCQWYLHRIRMPEAWNIATGSRDVVVALIDSGIDYFHTDLIKIPYVQNHDFKDGDPDPYWEDISHFTRWHGTFVTGIIAAERDNAYDIAGAADVSIMFLKVLRVFQWRWGVWAGADAFHIACALGWALFNGAKIVNMSFAASPEDLEREEVWVMKEAIECSYTPTKCLFPEFHEKEGLLLVAVAGNDMKNQVYFPASHPDVIAVSAIESDDEIWIDEEHPGQGSNYGKEIELTAPGANIVSIGPEEAILISSGTSFSAPLVAAVAALVWSCNPELSNREVRQILRTTAEDLGNLGKDAYYGFGLVNAVEAVKEACQGR